LALLGISPFLETLMPRFHFEIVDGVRVPDPVGTVCTEKQARQLASDIASQIVTDMGFDKARTIIVTDDAGSEIHKVLPEDLESRNVHEERTGAEISGPQMMNKQFRDRLPLRCSRPISPSRRAPDRLRDKAG
jgi:hypothetical protein